MKYLIGFFFGLLIASASAEYLTIKDGKGTAATIAVTPMDYKPPLLMTGRKPNGDGGVIPLDDDGNVICSWMSK